MGIFKAVSRGSGMFAKPSCLLRLRQPLLGFAFIAFATGCSTSQPKAVTSTLGAEQDHHVISKTAALSTTLVVPRTTKYFLCASPPPDAVFSQAETVGLSISMLNFGKDTDDAGSEASTEEAMVGRTPAVVLTRELLYRFCEFQLNHRLDRDQAIDLYRQNLSIIRDIALQEVTNTRITIGESQVINSNETTATAPVPRQRASAPQPSEADKALTAP